ncbi:tRNA adenosine(34) deaminase TadA [Thermithiobacillus plumbiphilus]|uniref:tRNA-specific adenosine deaminase n=1 Tax=Thermithiobacillus plumbiphilus TaxID=1729899 RepID=A0ABU9DB06_9PROT
MESPPPPGTPEADAYWMRRALELARHAESQGEVPVGAVLVGPDGMLGEGWNQPITTHDPTAHAEVVALRDAARRSANYRLTGATLYVTLEPCLMCAGAMLHARVHRLVYGATDPKGGAVQSLYQVLNDPRLNHRIMATEGVLGEEAGAMLRAFFRSRR